MTTSRDQIANIAEQATAIETEADRQAFLARTCPSPDVRREVDLLLSLTEVGQASPVPGTGTTADHAVAIGVSDYLGCTLDGKYRLDRMLGRGGMGAVFMATHLGTERIVAVKIIMPQFMRDDAFVERFRREARAAGRLRHPNIVDVTDFGFAHVGTERVAYLVMEYLDGCTLRELLAEENRLPLPWVVDLLEQVCSAVHEAHKQGIIHRDLKPDNIWLEPNRLGGFRAKVLDFGIAKLLEAGGTSATVAAGSATDPISGGVATAVASASTATAAPPASSPAPAAVPPVIPAGPVEPLPFNPGPTAPFPTSTHELTRAGGLLGTPTFMSPEQCRGEALDARSDIYSLGVVAYQMLCGAPPFAGDGASVIRAHIETQPQALEERVEKLRPQVSRVIMSALKKDPAARPQTAAAFANSLRANADGLGVLYRRAFALYSENFPQILKLSLIAHIPVFALLALSLVLRLAELAFGGDGSLRLWAPVEVLRTAATFVTSSTISGLVAIVVAQLAVAPLREIELEPAFAILKRRWKPFLKTSLLATFRILVGFVLLVVPGLKRTVHYSLWAPVVLMEGMEMKAALERSRTLGARSWWSVIIAVLFQFLLPRLVERLLRLGIGIGIEGGKSSDVGLTIATQFLSLSSVVVLPLLAIVPALLYLKLRQLGGETPSEVMAQLEPGARRVRWERTPRPRATTQRSP